MTRQTLFTRHFLVVKHGMYLAYARLSDVFRRNVVIYRKIIQEPWPEFLREEFASKSAEVTFELLNMEKLKSTVTVQDFKILNVADIDLNIAEKQIERQNVIQITFSERAILWDLDQNQEITCIMKQNQFANMNDYTATGFVLHQFLSQDRQLMDQTAMFSQNEDRSLLMSPKTDLQENILIRTYTGLNLMDVSYLKQRQKNGLVEDMIDTNTLLADFNGMTFFQIFRDPDYI